MGRFFDPLYRPAGSGRGRPSRDRADVYTRTPSELPAPRSHTHRTLERRRESRARACNDARLVIRPDRRSDGATPCAHGRAVAVARRRRSLPRPRPDLAMLQVRTATSMGAPRPLLSLVLVRQSTDTGGAALRPPWLPSPLAACASARAAAAAACCACLASCRCASHACRRYQHV
jgi:ABC-type ATPase with predicted acetyltransferase domain